MWEGYLPDIRPFWDEHGIPIIKVHGSGHAYVEELQNFVKALRPKHIIPNHTFHPDKYKEIFKGCDVMELIDGQVIDLK